jgi:hypothetical protein
MTEELLIKILNTDIAICITTGFILFSSNEYNMPMWILSLCKVLCFIALGAVPVLAIMVVWAAENEELLMKIFVTDFVILLTAGLVLNITRSFDVQKWITFLCKGLSYITLAAIPVLSVMAVWA